jgi:hypothetical protein
MNQTETIVRAVKGYTMAARAAKVLHVAHGVALGCAAASLAVGGARTAQKLMERHKNQ